MTEVDYLIIGGGIAGTSAAETIRNENSSGSIMIISDEPYRLYSRIMLSKPNFFLEKVPFDRIWIKTPEWYQEKNITLLTGKKAVSINPIEKTIALDDQQIIKYQKLLLAIGGEVRKLQIPGCEKQNVFYLRTLDDAKGIIKATKNSNKAMVIGGGFVGFEISDMLALAGIETTLIVREKYFWQNVLDIKTSQLIEGTMTKAGIKIIKENEVQSIKGSDKVNSVILKSGEKISCDLVIIGIGVNCPLLWLKDKGFETNCGILTNEYLETSQPDVWSAGDSAEFKDIILEEQVQLGNWTNAQMQGIIAGKNMTGKKEIYKNVTSYTTHGFGMTITFIGDPRLITGRQAIDRIELEKKSYSRIFIVADEIVGATLVNNQKEVGPTTKLIWGNIKINKHIKQLADPNFDLKTLL